MVSFGKQITIPIVNISTVSVYRDGVFSGNIVRSAGSELWYTSKGVSDEPVYFETLDDAKAYCCTV